MINVKKMYIRPGNLFKEFVIEEKGTTVTDTGRVAADYSGDGSSTLKGCLADADAKDKESRSTKEHTVTHTIVQAGAPLAKRTDKLILGERVFYIVDMDDTGELGVSTIYYAEERNDVK
ncbi:MAG: hypothetical protein NC293_07645 [Roseburia sp.]|nr:hypothetical protein [Roseburia sp.]